MNADLDSLREKLNAETGRIDWSALARHFARGVVIKVGPGLDLVEVATVMASDDKAVLEAWLTAGQIAKASIEDALDWHDHQASFWALVVAPWVLVQRFSDTDSSRT